MRVDRIKRLHSLATRAWHHPQELVRVAHKKLEQLRRSPLLRGLLTTQPADDGPQRPIDFSVDGPEADAIAAGFAVHVGKLPARLLVVRATKEPWPSWVTIARDQGWGGRAKSVAVCDVPANHLGVLRDPHVREFARAVSEVSEASPDAAA